MSLTLEVRHLQLVHAIWSAGSVTRAGGRLHLTQSALSHQLRDVEQRLGTRLFLRQRQKMVLTPAGERVLAAARLVIDELARAEDDLRALDNGSRGRLRLCAQCNTGYHWLPPLLEVFHRAFPAIEVHIEVNATDRPLAALFGGEIDLALVTTPVADRRLTVRPLFADELVAIVHPAHPLAARSHVEPRHLAAEHLITYKADRRDSYVFQHVLGPAGVEPARLSQVPLTEAILELVKAGLGVGVLARWAVEPAAAAGTVRALRITRRGIRREWFAVTLRGRAEPAWQREFVELLGRQALPAQARSHR